jgi:hypothetical protein
MNFSSWWIPGVFCEFATSSVPLILGSSMYYFLPIFAARSDKIITLQIFLRRPFSSDYPFENMESGVNLRK